MAKLQTPTPEAKDRLNSDGWETLDDTPVAIPAGFKRPETLSEQVQRLVRTSISEHAANQGYETFEEAEDFDIDDDFDPRTPYETFFDPVLEREITPQEFEANAEVYRKRYADAHNDYFGRIDNDGIMQENLLRRAVAREDARKAGKISSRPRPSGSPGGAGGQSPPAQDAPASGGSKGPKPG